MLHPVIQRLYRHHLSGEHHIPQRQRLLRLYLVQSPEIRNDPYRGNSPYDGVDLLLRQIFHQELRHHKFLFGDDLYPAAAIQGVIEILYGNIEIKGCLVAENRGFIEAKRILKGTYQIHYRAVADQNTLGNSR